MSAATSRSLTLRFCEMARSTSNASSTVHRFCPMMIPTAWSITAREANAACRCADISLRSAIRTANSKAREASSAKRRAASCSAGPNARGVAA
jgi:hypothetical protein